MKKGFLSVFVLVFALFVSCSPKKEQKQEEAPITVSNDIERVEPPHWWVGFKNNKLQLLVKNPNIANSTPKISKTGISIKKVTKADSPNYLFIDVEISETAKAGLFNIDFTSEDGTTKTQTYELKNRVKKAEDYIGFSSADAVYLITPDRFANADTSNDINSSLLEKNIDRTDDYARHGGDIKGITTHLEYIESLGYTAIWPSPLLTNNMPKQSYHGYAITDFYGVDPRFGTLDEYKQLAIKSKEKGIKLIMDQVANHCGLEHWWMKDLPFKDWVNYQDKFINNKPVTIANHKRTSNQDIYASKADKKEMTDGWFGNHMPDLNQRNPFLATYIIQNSIWWIETLELGGIRQDTYPYPDKDFMANWAGTIMDEYPNFSIVGEEWSYNPLLIAYWQKNNPNKDGYESNLTSTMDFAMQKNIIDALNEDETWGTGFIKTYEGLANDFAYQSPIDIMAFLDNHDMDRVYTQLNENIENTKMAVAYLALLPRIPQFYYGTEILMQNTAKPGDHGLIRTDFPGGWDTDTTNAFTGKGLTNNQKEMQRFMSNLLNFRKQSKAIHKGKTIHFAPQNGIYVLFRILNNEIVTIILNKNEDPYQLDLSRFKEVGLDGKKVTNIFTGETLVWDNNITLPKKGCYILTTNKLKK
ncbi:glycoside hydrolase family 13 protein [Cellulophaga lytica]|uniref:Alpha amylase catalytic region n=1 Tax=Cellulophaga lytica (strain ATCC 23178 / DSM 7489 / JCM 8516 / NBRC 14961 / NCIMB 1423 / VKM B-1433 / Cy l20) TaxID=867900 RepID=F0RHH5_CELLC|nr:glycoside hydrolase family 13 protein [Cellulophaga lytica]ADY30241.1 alpha amylase catalytic region [Cellulophaga lytica DSM 7489]WQG78824.1 glycoside hydrolase family 13 protein [Cellulophaga lytica]